MGKELKFKDGQKLIIEAIIKHVEEPSSTGCPYKLEIGTDYIYMFEYEVEVFEQKFIQNIIKQDTNLKGRFLAPITSENIKPTNDTQIDRAQMVASIYSAVLKDSEGASPIKSILEFIGKENEAYKYPEHWIEFNSKMALLHADAIISELNKTTPNEQ